MVRTSSGSSRSGASFWGFHRLRRLHRNDNARLPHRSGRRTTRKTSISRFVFVVFVVMVGFVPWFYLSSFLDVGNTDWNNNNNKATLVGNDENAKPLWNTCPNQRNELDIPQGQTDGDLCFVTCIFGETIDDVDQPANVEWFDTHWCYSRFLLVTNLPDLPSPGWTKIVVDTTPAQALGERKTVETNIVQSRHAKFLAWQALPEIVPHHCAAVVYMDGYLTPVRYTSWRSLVRSLFTSPPWSPASPLFLGIPKGQIPPPTKFQNVLQQVKDHPWGLSQVKQKYFDGLPMTTLLNNLVRDRKDTKEHVEKTLEFFRSQTTDFREIMPYYLNKYFAYDPNNPKYRELSSFFWDTYTSYGGLWRDQPLWAYLLHHFNVTPAVMTTEGTITKGGDLFRTGGKLGWDKHVYT